MEQSALALPMTLTIQLDEEQERRLRDAAAREGQEPEAYALALIDKGLRLQSLGEILAPIREDFVSSGMSEEELEATIENAREAVYRERYLQPGR